MKITNQQLRQIIKEELDNVLNESELHKLLGLSHEFSTHELYTKAREYIARNLENLDSDERGLISTAITNRMVKDQLPPDDPMAKDLSGLLNWLDRDRPRRQAYRSSTEREMRDLSAEYDERGVSPYSQDRPFKIRKQYE